MRNDPGQIPNRSAEPEMACGSKESKRPLSRFPLRGKAGAGGFPPRRKHAARQPKTLARIDAAGSPHKRAAAPLCIPRWVAEPIRCSGGSLKIGRPFHPKTSGRSDENRSNVYTKLLTLPTRRSRPMLPTRA
jgi:hypothetical protein